MPCRLIHCSERVLQTNSNPFIPYPKFQLNAFKAGGDTINTITPTTARVHAYMGGSESAGLPGLGMFTGRAPSPIGQEIWVS